MGYLATAWAFVRRLPVARYIKPLWKGALKALVQKQGDEFQARWVPRIAAGEVKAAKGAIGWWWDGVVLAFRILPLPPALETAWLEKCSGVALTLEAELVPLTGASVPLINAAFDRGQAALIAWIDSR